MEEMIASICYAVFMILVNTANPFNAPVYYEEEVSSTMDIARVLAKKGAPHGSVIASGFQHAGRGRIKDRQWKTDKGKNLIFTIILRFVDYSAMPKALTLKTGLAVSFGIEDFAPALKGDIMIKWPNDIMIRSVKTGQKGAIPKTRLVSGMALEKAAKSPLFPLNSRLLSQKLKFWESLKGAGILTEADGSTVYLGIGVNLFQREFPLEYRTKAGSVILALEERGIYENELPLNGRYVLLEKILSRLYRELYDEEWALSWRARLDRRLYKKGETVRFAEGSADSEKITSGILKGIGPEGELLIGIEGENKERAFITGELQVY
jgi:BirA family biotin operon repressor/biotin-[acetyl-CoA-carboxylase] ligase